MGRGGGCFGTNSPEGTRAAHHEGNLHKSRKKSVKDWVRNFSVCPIVCLFIYSATQFYNCWFCCANTPYNLLFRVKGTFGGKTSENPTDVSDDFPGKEKNRRGEEKGSEGGCGNSSVN